MALLQTSSFKEEIERSRQALKSFRARSDAERTTLEKMADLMTRTFGSMTFLIVNASFFLVWILINLDVIPGIGPFDPFPFGLLTMIVSLEAIFLSVFVLISQNRNSRIDELREEVDLQMDIITERELTKLLELVKKLLEKNNINVSKDNILNEMLHTISTEKIEKALEKKMDQQP